MIVSRSGPRYSASCQMSFVAQGEHASRERRDKRACQPEREPPRAVGAQQAHQQPDVPGDDPRGKAHPMLSLIHAPAQFAHAPADPIGDRASPPVGARCLHHVAQHVPDQADDRLNRALAHRDRAERRHGQDRDAMCRAGMRDHGPPRGLQGEIGNADRQLPAAVEKHPAARRD
jgi:hypothetical protein